MNYNPLTLADYQIAQPIYLGSRTLVYHGKRNADGKPVIIKFLRNEYPSFGELVQFSNQYTIAKNVNLLGIVQPLSLESYRNGYALVMPDEGYISLGEWQWGDGKTRNKADEETRKGLHVGEFLCLAVQLAEILQGLYENRVIHKDIKPANILIHPQTKQIKLIDFSIASLLPKETQEISNPNILEGTLAYISPEQTGRMNRGIDYRTDFYSLGVTFYEMLTGKLPFTSHDPLELVHFHMAKMPSPLKMERKEIPPVISDIVMRLMAKNAEDRYQSALGLKHDLEKCLNQWKETETIPEFELGERDLSDRFLIPDKLYGREKEVTQLLTAFERVANGDGGKATKSEMVMVAGFSGIGKTAVVNEVHKPIVKERGYFIKGKYDQFNRNIPFSAFVQALRSLMGQLLGETDAQLANWRGKILEAVGENGQVIIDVIPELEHIIGPQPSVLELSGNAAQNRFNLLFGKFIRVFTTQEHPLVIFFDDLQWADSASLKLLKLLMEESEASYLLVLGAYRDNEVSPVHPLMLTLDEITKQGATLNTLTLDPLDEVDVTRLVADTLLCSPEKATPLSRLVYQKTKGNPFFATQFLEGLHEDNWITFNTKAECWQCDLAQVQHLALTDDAVQFMVGRLRKLPQATQEVLKLAACVGNRFDLATLAVVCQGSQEEVAADLWTGLQEGFIIPESETYKFFQGNEDKQKSNEAISVTYRFLHDRVQQAAYALILNAQKEATHYQIGQLLLEQVSPEAREERIFELVSHLNYGTTLITEQKERDELAHLNLIACRKARTATAYQAGREYAAIGLELLGENAWQQQYETTLAFHELGAELSSLCGDIEEMERFIEVVITQAQSLLEKINVNHIRITSNIYRNKPTEGIAIAQQLLKELGINFPESITGVDIQKALGEIHELIGNREIADLAKLPVMLEQEKIAIIQTANSIMPAASIIASPILPLLVALSVKLSIQHGNTSASALAYAAYGIMSCNFLQNVEIGVKFGHLSLQIVSQMDAKAIEPQVFNVAGEYILHREVHLKKTLPILLDGYTTSLEVGNLEFAGYNAQIFCLHSFCCSPSLGSLEKELGNYCRGLTELNQLTTANWCRVYWQSTLNLLEVGENSSTLSGKALQEDELLLKLTSAKDLRGLFVFYSHKLILCYLFEELELAQNYGEKTRELVRAGQGTLSEPICYFYDSLAALSLPLKEKTEILEQVEKNQAQLQQQWAKNAPMNYQHKFDLVEAEKCRVLGKKVEAIELYDQAISGAKANQYIQEEALANELAAKFYLDWNKEKVAAGYMQEAYYCYARWGAKAKVDHLEQCYPQLLTAILQPHNLSVPSGVSLSTTLINSLSSTSSSHSLWLDFPAVMKAAQAISEEIELEKLLSTLMQLVIANAGAESGHLVLCQDNYWFVVAQADQEETETLEIPFEEYPDLPHSLIYAVIRTQEIAVFEDLSAAVEFSGEDYVTIYQPKSVLCTPLIRQGQITGILYLENNLTVGAFTSDRVEMLTILTSKAAISLENARLYKKTENYSYMLEAEVEQKTKALNQKAQDLEKALKQLQKTQGQLIHNEKMSSLGQLVAGIAHEMNNPVNFIKGNLLHTKDYMEDIMSLLELYQQEHSQPSAMIKAKSEEIDLDFVFEDATQLLESMKAGSDRISEIVSSLQNFSRLNESGIKTVDLHSGIESTLLILQGRLQDSENRCEVRVIKEYGQLPMIDCYPSQLNQVFLHIINNAIDAIRGNHDGRENPEIRIRTEVIDKTKVSITIANTDSVISEDVQEHIFEPFFTTKPIGSGTGLGLFVSYSIIEQHGGTINVRSQPGEGTEFEIVLPQNPVKS